MCHEMSRHEKSVSQEIDTFYHSNHFGNDKVSTYHNNVSWYLQSTPSISNRRDQKYLFVIKGVILTVWRF